MADGFYAMHRGWMEHPVLRGPLCRAAAWAWLIESACWKQTRTSIKGNVVMLERGQLSYSVRYLADAWQWPKSVVGRFIDRLETETMIRTDNGTGQLIITICNYDRYQASEEKTGTVNGTHSGTGAGQERDGSGTNKNKGNKDNNTEAKASSGQEPPEDDLKMVIFSKGLGWLAKHTGREEKNLRPIIGRWCATHGDGKTLEAMREAQRDSPIDPVAYIEKILDKSKGLNGHKPIDWQEALRRGEQ